VGAGLEDELAVEEGAGVEAVKVEGRGSVGV